MSRFSGCSMAFHSSLGEAAENSPRFQPWVGGGEWPEPLRGERKAGTGSGRSSVPVGTRFIFAPQPSDESLGYFRASLRDVVSRHGKQIPIRTTDATCVWRGGPPKLSALCAP